MWQWVRKGVPLRLEIGPRDLEKDAVFAARRDRAPKDKQSVSRAEFVATIASTLQAIQDGCGYDKKGMGMTKIQKHL